jgi:hypothetical protein
LAARENTVGAVLQPKRLFSRSNCSWLSDHDGNADDRENTATHHVHDVLWLPRSTIDGICDFGTDSSRGARDGVFAIEALNEKENAEGDEDNADNIFHGD